MTIEEYLHSLISLIEELARLAVNSVTLGDYHRPLEISRFVKDLHAGFQILNLKNDTLRKRSDSVKYNVKKIEGTLFPSDSFIFETCLGGEKYLGSGKRCSSPSMLKKMVLRLLYLSQDTLLVP